MSAAGLRRRVSLSLLLVPAIPAILAASVTAAEPASHQAQSPSAAASRQAPSPPAAASPQAQSLRAAASRQAPSPPAAAASQATAGATYYEQELDDVPAARDLWGLLERQVPVIVSQRLDVGGSATGRQGFFSARGTSWTQNVFRLDGVEMTDPAVRGTSGFYYDNDALQRVEVSWGSQPADVATSGVRVDLALQSGTDEVHGAAQGYFAFDALQAGNLDADLEAAGVGLASSIDYLSDVSVQVGGPLAPGRAWIFGSYRDWRISQAVPNHDEPVAAKLPVATAKATARLASGDSLAVFWSRQGYRNPARNAGRFVAAEANSLEDSTFQVVGGQWDHAVAAGGRLDGITARASFLDIDLPLLLRPGAVRQSQLDIVAGLRSGSAPLEIRSSRRRYAAEAVLAMSGQTGRLAHSVRGGLQYQHAPTETALAANGDVNLVTSSAASLVAQLLNTPIENRQNARAIGVFVHDDIEDQGRWLLQLGLRYDDWNGSFPAQSSPAGTYTPARSFAASGDAIGWRGLGPRVTFAFDVLGDDSTEVVVGFSQYTHSLATSTLSLANPNSLGVRVVPWNDLNGDGQFQPGEGGPVAAVSGGPFGAIDPDVRAPLTRELRAGIDYDLGSGWNARLDLWYRKDSNLFDDVEVGLGPADFATEIVRDPGRDNLVGTGDDGGLVIFNQVEGFGDNRLRLTTVDAKATTYRGMDLVLQRQWADNWRLHAVVTLGLAEGLSSKSGPVPGDAGGISDLFNDPNSLINADARLFWDRPYVLKVHGSWLAPRGVLLGAVLRSWAGAPLGRILPVPLNQGLVNVWAEPMGALREDSLTTLDVRLAKSFARGGGRQIGIFLDLFNVTNAATVTRTADTTPNFATPAEILPPFLARIGARVAF